MTTQLTDKFRIDTLDNSNVALQKIGKNKDGEPRWDNISYYGSLYAALGAAVDHPATIKECKDLEEYKEFLNIIMVLKYV